MTEETKTAAWSDDALAAVRTDLDRRGLVHAVGPGGEVLVPFEDGDRRLVITYRAGEEPLQGVTIVGAPMEPIPRERWGATLLALNGWNCTTVGPRAYLYADDWTTADTATIMIELWMPVTGEGQLGTEPVTAATDAMLTACALFVAAGVDAPEG